MENGINYIEAVNYKIKEIVIIVFINTFTSHNPLDITQINSNYYWVQKVKVGY